jgi:opacity protein-like surface antigen
MKLINLSALTSALVLAWSAASAQAVDAEPGAISVRVSAGAGGSRGDLFPAISGRGALDNNDVFKTSRQFSLGFGFAVDTNSQLTLDLTRRQGEGKSVLLRPGTIPLRAALSDDKSTSAMVGYEYALNGLNASGLVLGAGLGYERRDALTVSALPVASRTLFEKSSGLTGDVRIGYQFAVADNALIRVALTPTYSAKRKFKQTNLTALGLGVAKESAAWTLPITAQFEYRF